MGVRNTRKCPQRNRLRSETGIGWEAGIRPRSQLAEARRVEPKASCDVKESASHQKRGFAALLAGCSGRFPQLAHPCRMITPMS